MTINQLLRLIEDGNTALRMFDQDRFERYLYIEVNGTALGYFDNATDFEIALRNEYTFDYVLKVIKTELTPANDDSYPWTYYNAIDQKTGEVLARVEMYDKN